MNGMDVQGTFRDMWETRPARPRQDRQLAGVASAIGRRYDIDPTLVRVGFVVTAFLGVGALLYIAGWATLPEEPASPTAPQRRQPRPVMLVGFGIATVGTLATLLGGGGGGGLVGTVAVLGMLYLLHRHRARRGLAAAPSTGLTTASAGRRVSLTKRETTNHESTGHGVGHGGPGQEALPGLPPPQQPPSWDPLGAAPFAWDLPEPSAPPPPPAPRRSALTGVTLGLALLAGGLTTAILLVAGALTPATVPVAFGVALSVIGIGLLVGAFLRVGRGLIPFALVLMLATWGMLTAPLDRWGSGEVGDLQVAPITVAALAPTYDRSAGSIQLDLRNLDLSAPPGVPVGEPVRTAVTIGAGDVTVLVPANADVTAHATVGVGEVRFGENRDGGPEATLHVVDDLGADGVRSGRPLVLDLEGGAGSLEVRRG